MLASPSSWCLISVYLTQKKEKLFPLFIMALDSPYGRYHSPSRSSTTEDGTVVWRSKARDISRRPLLVKQLAVFAAVIFMGGLLWLYKSRTYDEIDTIMYTSQDALAEASLLPSGKHHSYPGHSLVEPQAHAPSQEIGLAKSVEPIVFALIMWAEESAAEGALLIKVRELQYGASSNPHILASRSSCMLRVHCIYISSVTKPLAIILRPD